ncbi:hypothetical protein GCM10010266_59230 [Streptomyces griseomycini]|uniref:Uncharacterized protein n=1 Tax=Streptomyces griseomycini TaxID=66895 RepID=A0A7W7PSE2_9ACTN|nr:hypothetical protein [Streptomyces griseomycini]GGQ28071.1 hypothetical protein GCM10010266_59230 [Streptomyces griseomycini]GGR35375.1 hypothetical protein GCM10015536_46300 [Streptomyces griseomycini]
MPDFDRVSKPSEADDAAGESGQALVEAGPLLVANTESFELVEPGEGPPDDPPGASRSGSVGGLLDGRRGA